MKRFLSLAITFLWLTLTPQAAPADQQSVPEVVLKVRKSVSRVDNMRCTFIKKVVKAGKAFPEAQMEMRYLREPKTIFVNFITPNKGQKCLYVKGNGQDKIIVRPSGFLKFMRLKMDPSGEEAMKESLNPMTEMDFYSILESFEVFYRNSLSDEQYEAAFIMDVEEDGKPLHLLKIDSGGQSGNYLYLYIDRDTSLPYKIRYKNEKDTATYTYRNVLTNTDLGKEAFKI